MTVKVKTRPDTIEEALDRYPRLVGHMICESQGYFTPRAAANAVLHYIQGHAFFCEWYRHMAWKDQSSDNILDIGREVTGRAFSKRHRHQGFMADYPTARAMVEDVRGGGEGPLFMSW